jgi:hypothetical protein
MCVGKEIDWPHRRIGGIDQSWSSAVDSRQHRFSTFAYQYISYDLFLDGWVESAPEPTDSELGFLEDVPRMRALLRECEEAARVEQNTQILPLIGKAKDFIDTLERAILFRFESLGDPQRGRRRRNSQDGTKGSEVNGT